MHARTTPTPTHRSAARPWWPARSAGLLLLAGLAFQAQATTNPPSATAKVVVSGDVPDEATRQAILGRARELYGTDRVVDQLGVRALSTPPQWLQHVQRALHPDLKQISRGQLDIRGNVLEIRGEVASEAVREQVLTTIRTQLNNTTYTVRNGLRVSASGQDQLDAALANRIVEFEAGSATLTSSGQEVLVNLAKVMRQMPNRRFEVIGHTDAQGPRLANLSLSAARADAVKAYLGQQGISSTLISTSGAGPDRPVASNDSNEGRARNRRIEVRALNP